MHSQSSDSGQRLKVIGPEELPILRIEYLNKNILLRGGRSGVGLRIQIKKSDQILSTKPRQLHSLVARPPHFMATRLAVEVAVLLVITYSHLVCE